jgi:hypothetical protein
LNCLNARALNELSARKLRANDILSCDSRTKCGICAESSHSAIRAIGAAEAIYAKSLCAKAAADAISRKACAN